MFDFQGDLTDSSVETKKLIVITNASAGCSAKEMTDHNDIYGLGIMDESVVSFQRMKDKFVPEVGAFLRSQFTVRGPATRCGNTDFVFKIKFNILGYFDLVNVILSVMKINDLQVNVTDVSAKTYTPRSTVEPRKN